MSQSLRAGGGGGVGHVSWTLVKCMPVFAMNILLTYARDCSSIVGNNASNLQLLLGRRPLHPNHVVPAFKTLSNFQMSATKFF